MLLIANLRMALRALWVNRLRTLLTMLGIVVGVASVVLLIAYSAGVEHELLSRFDRRGATLLSMGIASWRDDVPSSVHLDTADVQAVRDECWTIESAALTSFIDRGSIEYMDRERADCDIYAAQAEYFVTRNTDFADGRPFTAAEEAGLEMVCVLGGVIHRELFFEEPAVGKLVTYNGRPLRVVGVLAEQGGRPWESTDTQVAIPHATAESFFNLEQRGGDLLLKVREFELMPYAEKQVRELLLERHPRLMLVADEEEQRGRRRSWREEGNGIWVWSSYEWREQRVQVAESLTRFLVVMGALALLIGCVGVMNIMLVTVEERTAEIGLRKAMGASILSILAQFLTEAVAICFTGGLLGSLAAYVVVRYLERLPDELQVPDPIFTPVALAVALTVTISSGLASGMYPALNAATLDPIEALRHE